MKYTSKYARRGEARRGEARRGEARRGEARRGEARRGEARRGEAIQDVRSHKDLLCNVILFVVHTICVASSISMMIWSDHSLLLALWFRFHIELAKCLLFGVRFSYLIPNSLRTRRERSGAPHASLVYNLVVVWVVWNNFFFHMALRHDCYV